MGNLLSFLCGAAAVAVVATDQGRRFADAAGEYLIAELAARTRGVDKEQPAPTPPDQEKTDA